MTNINEIEETITPPKSSTERYSERVFETAKDLISLPEQGESAWVHIYTWRYLGTNPTFGIVPIFSMHLDKY